MTRPELTILIPTWNNLDCLKHCLASLKRSLDRLAQDIGYESASAFSTAFRRRFGCSPGTFARSHRSSDAGREVNAC